MSLKNIATSMVALLGVFLTACEGRSDGETSSTVPAALGVIERSSGDGERTSKTDTVEVIGKITTTITGPNLGLSNGPTTWYITTKYYSASDITQSPSGVSMVPDNTGFTLFGYSTPDDVTRDRGRALVIHASKRGRMSNYEADITLGFGRPLKEMYYAPNSRASVETTKFVAKDGVAHIIGSFSGELRQDKEFGGIISINGQFEVKLPAE